MTITRPRFFIIVLLGLGWGMLSFTVSAQTLTPARLREVMGKGDHALVMINVSSGETVCSDEKVCEKKLPPCSTFKVWNTLIGLETGLITSPDEPFYKWDGETRFIPEWNRDLTLREAYQVSCVPAYQALARRVGHDRMKAWIGRLPYGDANMSAGLDVFWLPEKGRETLMITPMEQARLMSRLAKGDIPASSQSLDTLREIMKTRATSRGTLYGKTGTGKNPDGQIQNGWFVGYVVSGKTTYAFAATGRGVGLTGRDIRSRVEKALEMLNLL